MRKPKIISWNSIKRRFLEDNSPFLFGDHDDDYDVITNWWLKVLKEIRENDFEWMIYRIQAEVKRELAKLKK